MKSLNQLTDYIKSGFMPSPDYMSAIRDGIRYIYEFPEVLQSNKNSNTAELIGIYVTDTFYSLTSEYSSEGKDFMQEFSAFEQLYNNAFDKQMKKFSAQSPIGGKISASVELRLEDFRKNDIERVASDLIFGNNEMTERPVDDSYYEPLFLRYLMHGNKSIEDTVKADINEHADELNFTMLSEDMAYKYAAKMLQDNKLVEKIALYGKIKRAKDGRFIIAVDFESTIIENIEIDRDKLMQMVKHNDTFTYKGKLIINFEDIKKIFNDEQIIYEKI